MNFTPSSAFDFNLGYSLTDARIAEYTSSNFTQNVSAGNRLKRVPRDKVSAWAFYNAPFSSETVLRLGFGAIHTGSFYSDETKYPIRSIPVRSSTPS